MAKHVLERGAHPVYPYGVQYGAGAGVEVHLAALVFATVGISDASLKTAGLLVWLASLALVFAIGRRIGGPGAGAGAAVLFAFAPQSAQWSLKVGGGHNVAVLLCLVAILLRERQAPRWTVAALLPVAAIAHPIVAPFAVVMAVHLFWTGPDRWDRVRTLAALLGTSAAVAILLRPPGSGVWNPAARDLDAGGLLSALPSLALTAFTPNLNAARYPGPLALVASLLWLVAFAASLAWRPAPRRIVLYALAPLGVLLTVQPAELAPRHLLLLYPVACLATALALLRLPRGRVVVGAVLLLAGAAVQVATMSDPNVYGPSPQDRGIVRDNVRGLVQELESRGIRHVYCLDPMFQWNLIWESRERVLARWADPLDRFPEYPARVDAARLGGRPVALVGEVPVPGGGPQRFGLLPLPDARALEAAFPMSPRVGSLAPG